MFIHIDIYLLKILLLCILSFFVSLFLKTQPNHWTKQTREFTYVCMSRMWISLEDKTTGSNGAVRSTRVSTLGYVPNVSRVNDLQFTTQAQINNFSVS